MGKHLAEHSPRDPEIAPTAIRYTLGKRLSIHADLQAGLGIRETARRHGVSPATVHAISKDTELAEMQDQAVVDARKKAMANYFDYNSDRALSTVDQAKLNAMNAYQLTMIAAVSTDKARLLRDESTENVSVRGVVEHIQKEMLEISEKRRKILGE